MTLDLLREAGPVVVGEQQVPQPIFVIAADPISTSSKIRVELSNTLFELWSLETFGLL